MSYIGRHGVYIQENATPIIPPVTADNAVQFVVGTAPIQQLDDPYESLNRIRLIHNMKEFTEAFGWSNDFATYTLCQAASASFQVFNVAPLLMVNVYDPFSGAEERKGVSVPFRDGSATMHAADILRGSITVEDPGGDIYQECIDYAVSYKADSITISRLSGGSIPMDVSELKVSYAVAGLCEVSAKDIIGGYDANAGTYTGIELVEQCYPQLGILPCTLSAPGFSQIPEVAIALLAKTKGINGAFNALAVVDIDSTEADTYDKVQEWKNRNGYTDPHLVACWPKAVIGEKEYFLSTLAAARIAQTDADNDNVPYVSPSNKALRVTGTVNAKGVPVYLDQVQGNYLNGAGIVTAINLNGWRLWGNSTTAYPSITDPKDRWIAARRMFNWWGNTFILTYFQKVDSPMNRRLIQSILDSENVRANGYAARGQLAGAKIEYIEDDNPVTDLLDGKIRFRQYLTPFPPAETIINVLEFDPGRLKASLGGEEA